MRKKILFQTFSVVILAVFLLNSANIFGEVRDDSKEKSPVVILTSSNFDKETSQGLVLVDFWAPWCGPCRRMAPILDEIATEYKASVKIGKLNVDNYKKFSTEKGIEALPTIVVYKDGKEVDRIVGLVSKDELVKAIESYSDKK